MEDLRDLPDVDEDGNGLGGELELESDVRGAERELIEAEHSLEEVVEVDASAAKLRSLPEAEVVLEEVVKADGLCFQRLEPTVEVALQGFRQLGEAVAQAGELNGHGVEGIAQLVREDPSIARGVLEAGMFTGELEKEAGRPCATEVVGEALEGLSQAGPVSDRTPRTHRERSDDLVAAADGSATHTLDAQQTEQVLRQARVLGRALEEGGLSEVEPEQRAILARVPGEIEAREVGGVDAGVSGNAEAALHGVILLHDDEVEAGDQAELAGELGEDALTSGDTVQLRVQARQAEPRFRQRAQSSRSLGDRPIG